MKILIIDDDVSLFHDIRLQFQGENIDFINEVRVDDALKRIKEEEFDLVILDCVLDEDRLGGLTLGAVLYEMSVPFIFITGHHSNHILDEMLKFRPLTYIQKPIDPVTLAYHVKTFKNLLNEKDLTIQSIQNGPLYIKKGSKVYSLALDQIKHIEVRGNYLTLVDVSDKKYVIKQSLKRFLAEHNTDNLLKVRRNFLINPHFVESIDFQENTISIKGKLIPFSRTYKHNVRNILK